MRITDEKEVLLDNASYLKKTGTHMSNVGININMVLTSQEGDGNGMEEQGTKNFK
jgi:hypothetical protein